MNRLKKITVGIHEGLNRSRPLFLRRYEQILQYNNIRCEWLNINDSLFWEQLRNLDLFIFRFLQVHSELQLADSILPIIETHMKIKCFPDQNTCWHFDDKIKQFYLLKLYNYPIVDTWIFWDKKSALQFLKKAQFPLVFKLKGGAGSSNVGLVEDINAARHVVKRMFSIRGVRSGKIPVKNNLHRFRNLFTLYPVRHFIAHKRGRTGPAGMYPYWQIQRDYVMFQKFLPQNQYDIRITIIGDRAFAFRRFNRPNDFRASGSGHIDYDISKVDHDAVKICFDISKRLNFQSMAYDLIYDIDDRLKLIEMSYTFVDEAVYNCPGYFDPSLTFHEGHYWPQFCHLQDLIGEVQLSPPPKELMSY